MTIETLKNIFLFCFLLNMFLLIWWFLFISLAHDWVYRWHSKFIPIPVEKFNAIHYTGMTYFKVFIFSCNLVPYLGIYFST